MNLLHMKQALEFAKSGSLKVLLIAAPNISRSIKELEADLEITAIWNFAPYKLNVPKGISVQNENLALSLTHLNNQLCNFN